jgi:hypothetical protein
MDRVADLEVVVAELARDPETPSFQRFHRRGLPVRFPCRAAYLPVLRVCLIELTFLVHPDITAAQVAASIVHEGEHARIEAENGGRAGPTPAETERRCREAEIEFGLAVPGGEAVVARARGALGLADDEVAPAIDWELAAERVAEVDFREGRAAKPSSNS